MEDLAGTSFRTGYGTDYDANRKAVYDDYLHWFDKKPAVDPYSPDPPKPGDKSGSGGKDSSKADRLAGVIGGGREGVKHITITIGSLIEGGVTISTTTLRDGSAKAKQILTEALLSVANDANYAQ